MSENRVKEAATAKPEDNHQATAPKVSVTIPDDTVRQRITQLKVALLDKRMRMSEVERILPLLRDDIKEIEGALKELGALLPQE